MGLSRSIDRAFSAGGFCWLHVRGELGRRRRRRTSGIERKQQWWGVGDGRRDGGYVIGRSAERWLGEWRSELGYFRCGG
jgi:hypothetical protein